MNGRRSWLAGSVHKGADLTLNLASRTLRWLRRRGRVAIMAGFGFVASRPRLHRRVKLAYQLVPGLRTGLNRLVPPPLTIAGLVDPNDVYVFRPPQTFVDAGGVITLDHLYHLSRSL